MNNTFKLYNGVDIPKIMIGTYSINGDEAIQVFKNAIDVGYTGIDCGRYYKNEADWGNAIKQSGIDRKKVFIQTKVDYSQEKIGFDVRKDFAKTLQNFHTDYIDCLLIHWPVFETFINTWKVLEELYSEGKIKAIGVSNFRIEHLEILKTKCRIMPMVNQIERHPCRKQEELVNYCKKNNILLEAYQPLAVCNPKLMKNEILLNLAEKYKCSVPQVALSWNITTGVIPLPRSKHANRLKENFNSLFLQITKEDIELINRDKDHYCRIMKESDEFPGYWDQIHKVNEDLYLGGIV